MTNNKRVNILGGVLDIPKLKNEGRKLESINKAKDAYLFSRSDLIEEIYIVLNDEIREIELRFDTEAYKDADKKEKSSIRDAIFAILPPDSHKLKDINGTSEWVKRAEMFGAGSTELITVRYLEENYNWRTVVATLNIDGKGIPFRNRSADAPFIKASELNGGEKI